MQKQTIEAFFPRSPERVWRAVTDPTLWEWPGGPEWVREAEGGRRIVTEDKDGTETVFYVTAFAPGRWFAVELENPRTAGRCEALFFRERGGTRLELSADLYGKTAAQKLLLRLRLRQWQERYVDRLARALRVR